MISLKDFLYFLGVGVILLVYVENNSLIAKAQEPLQWTPQERIPLYRQDTEEPPLLIVDQNHTVHAFNSQPLELADESSTKEVVYRQWTLAQGWTDPIDIIVSPGGGDANVMGTYFDQTDVVHLVFEVGRTEIYYSQAPLAYAGQATAWSEPQLVGQQSLPTGPGLPYNAAIIGNNQGRLVIVYSGEHDGNGIYVTYSDDNGQIWSEPVSIFLTYDDKLIVADPKLYRDHSGQIHAVWNTFNEGGIGVSGHYARLDIETKQWSVPVEFDEGGVSLGIKFATLTEHDNNLILAYYGGKDNANFWRQSSDGGLNWSSPVRISSRHVGTNGPLSFAVDSNNVLHAFFGQRINDNNHGMWHTIWTASGWTEPRSVVRGPQVKDEVGGNGFDPRSAKAVIVNGNLILVTWGTDGAAGVNGAWYSYATLDTPELPAVPLIIPTDTPAKITTAPSVTPALPTVTPSSTQPSFSDEQNDNRVNGVLSNPSAPLVIGLAPVVLLLVIVIIRQFTQATRQ